jgi:hypothetical protein
MKLTHCIIDTMEVPCGACQIAQRVCQRKQNLINLNKRNICRSTGQTGHIINQILSKDLKNVSPAISWKIVFENCNLEDRDEINI